MASFKSPSSRMHCCWCLQTNKSAAPSWWLIDGLVQDLPRAMSASELADQLMLHKLRGRKWYIQGCTATNGDGMYEGLDWMSSAIRNQ